MNFHFIKRVWQQLVSQFLSNYFSFVFFILKEKNKTKIQLLGRVSNLEHSKTPIGSAQKNRELGNRPRSGLWQRKTGRFGRKLRALPPLRKILPPKDETTEVLRLTMRDLVLYKTKVKAKH